MLYNINVGSPVIKRGVKKISGGDADGDRAAKRVESATRKIDINTAEIQRKIAHHHRNLGQQ